MGVAISVEETSVKIYVGDNDELIIGLMTELLSATGPPVSSNTVGELAPSYEIQIKHSIESFSEPLPLPTDTVDEWLGRAADGLVL